MLNSLQPDDITFQFYSIEEPNHPSRIALTSFPLSINLQYINTYIIQICII